MARKRREKSSAKRTPTGLERAFGSAPTHPGRYVLYVNHDKYDRRSVQIFAALYSAKKYLDLLIEDDEISWYGNTTLVSESGVRVKCDELKQIFNHKYTELERDWELPAPYPGNAARIRYGGPREEEVVTEKAKTAKRKGESTKPASTKAAKKDKGGLTSIGDIAKEMKMKPRDARAILRKQKVKKPDVGWAWSKDQVEGIKKTLKKG